MPPVGFDLGLFFGRLALYPRPKRAFGLCRAGARPGKSCTEWGAAGVPGEYENQGGCEMAHTPNWGTVLAVVHQADPDYVCLYDVGSQCPTKDVTWGSIKAMYK